MIYAKRGTPKQLQKLEDIFSICEILEQWEFSHVHKAVLGILNLNLEVELQNSLHRIQIDLPDSKGHTALHWAAQRSDHLAVQTLLQNGANPNARRDDKRTPLHLSGSVRCTELLLIAGADVHAVDKHGHQALHYACGHHHGDLAIVKALVMAGASVLSRNNYGSVPLSFSIQQRSCEVGAYLIHQGADIDNIDNDGDTPLFDALFHGSHEFLELLLSERADYRTVNKAGFTILHIATIYGDTQSIQILIRAALRGLDTEAKDSKGRTARQALEQRPLIPEGFIEAFEEVLQSVRKANQSPIIEEDNEDEEDEFVEALEIQNPDGQS